MATRRKKTAKKTSSKKRSFDVVRLQLDTSGSRLKGKALRAAALRLLEIALKTPKATARAEQLRSASDGTPCDRDGCVFVSMDGPFVKVYFCDGEFVSYKIE